MTANAVRIPDFDEWRGGYAGATVAVRKANTTILASLFLDPLMTVPTANPQTLITLIGPSGEEYGKFAAPVYVDVAYSLLVNMTSGTGVSGVPITDLIGEDASQAIATSARGANPLTMSQAFDVPIDVRRFGDFVDSNGAAAITAAINGAVGAAAAQGGGNVILPAGDFQFTAVTLPLGVVLAGQAPGATTLRSVQSGAVITLGGDGAGLRNLTLDGVDLVPGSFGVDGINIVSAVFDNVLIQRFDTGLRLKGADAMVWTSLDIQNCNTGADLRGDSDVTTTGEGTAFENLSWRGGTVALCTVAGVVLECIDRAVNNIVLDRVSFVGNTGEALKMTGVRGLVARNCWWLTNTKAITVQDGTDTSQLAINTTDRVWIEKGTINGGTLLFNGTCMDVRFAGVEIINASFNLSVPTATIMLQDCAIDASTTYTGDVTKIGRQVTPDVLLTAGITTDANPITGWQMPLVPGEVCLVEVGAVAKRRDGTATGIFFGVAGAVQHGAIMTVSSVTAAFPVGSIATGQTSGATGRVVLTTISGSDGTMTLIDIAGTFISGEEVQNDTDASTARVAGSIAPAASGIDPNGYIDLRPPFTDGGYAMTIDCSGPDVRVRITGAAGHTVEWLIKTTVTRL